MRIVLACLALGVAAIAAVGSLDAAVQRGMQVQGRVLLGGDLAIDGGAQPLPDRLRTWLAARGGRVSAIVTMRSLLVAASGDRMLVDLKVVDGAYPLAGAVALQPAIAIAGGAGWRGHRRSADPAAAAAEAGRHGAPWPGAPGAARGAGGRARSCGQCALLGPRAIIGAADLPATGLVQPGSLLTYEWRVVLPANTDPARVVAAIRHDFPDSAWRIRTSREPPQGLDRAISQTDLFLTLVGLSSLLVGGIGVATGVRAWLEARAGTIATMRCLGGEERLIFGVILIQVLGLCAVGVAIGVLAGAALPAAAIAVFGADSLPVPAQIGVYPAPLAMAAVYGMLTAAAFALWPLGRAARIPGAALFRDAILPSDTAPRPAVIVVALGVAAGLVALIVLGATAPVFALSFCGCALATLGIFRAGASALMAAARRAPRVRAPWLRLGFANLHRPGSATPLLVVALGLGLATLTSVALIEGNIRGSLLAELPKDAPSFFFIDIQNAQLPEFMKLVQAEPGVRDVREVPSLRARDRFAQRCAGGPREGGAG